MGIEFHATRMGAQFFNGTVPKLINTLNRIAAALEKKHEDSIRKDDLNERHLDINSSRISYLEKKIVLLEEKIDRLKYAPYIENNGT